jgi:predicted nucleotidyltransferase
MATMKPLEELMTLMRETHGCHTVILYGSHARGEATPTSDWDVFGVRSSGPRFRDARRWRGTFLDAFIFPEKELEEPDPTLFRLMDSVVLTEKDGYGTRLIQRIKERFAAGPPRLPDDERQARLVWMEKNLERLRVGDIEGNYRRHGLLTVLLQDYFVLQGLWYRGPKESFRELRRTDRKLYDLFAEALAPEATYGQLEKLVGEVRRRVLEAAPLRAP